MNNDGQQARAVVDITAAKKARVDARLDAAVRSGAPMREVYDLIQESACLFEALELRRDGLCSDTDQKPSDS